MLATSILQQEVPITKLGPPPQAVVEGARFEVCGWSRVGGSARGIVGLVDVTDSAEFVFAYRLAFRDRATGQVFNGMLAHGIYSSSKRRDEQAERHYRAGVVDAVAEIGERRAALGVAR